MSKDRLYLAHIIECIGKIEEYTKEGKTSFATDQKTQDAVLRNLHTLSESAIRITDELKKKYDDIAWREIHAFRNVVVHDYLGLELNQVWNILAADLPVLKKGIEKIISELK
jgi:uncharacterized protein with HEPN domain